MSVSLAQWLAQYGCIAVLVSLLRRLWHRRSSRGAARALALALIALAAFNHQADAGALGPQGLRARYTGLAAELAQARFGRPLVIESREGGRRVEGDVYAVLDHPFPQVSEALSDAKRWCDILILHLNTKQCRSGMEGGERHIELRVGKKHEQPVNQASLLAFHWAEPQVRADYLQVQMEADDGPYDTRDYLLLAEAVPLPDGRSFLHMGYGFSAGGASGVALGLYLSTVARDKVGFTVVGSRGGEPAYVGGMRGVTERNTMRYYLAIDAYLASLSAPPQQQLDKRLTAWFDATEHYARQLHELDREAYLRMKRNEWQRQLAAQ